MKIKTLATALTVTIPLVFGTAIAQTTTTPEQGNNRAADGGAMTTNQNATQGSGATTGASGAATGASGATTGATGATTPAPTPGAAGAADRATPNATAPGMETQNPSAASTEAITGWSVKDDMMGKNVVNENDEKIGDIEDVVVSSDGRTMYLLVGAGGFLGMGSKNVAVPFDRFDRRDDKIVLSGYTKEQLKALPEVRTNR